jgi:hypothetical protein
VFEELRLLGPREESIILHTRRRTEIPNVIEVHPPPAAEQARFERLCRGHAGWQVRKPPTGIYNCFGHAWASRRTSVFDDLEKWVRQVREDDGYRVLDPGREPLLSGDLVLYWQSVNPHANFFHVGVVEMREGVTPRSPRVPWVVSKWDSRSGEVFHHYLDVPKEWEQVFGNVAVEFWTDRPPHR